MDLACREDGGVGVADIEVFEQKGQGKAKGYG